MNKDAISKQNSAAMVEQLTTMSQQRQKIIARNFANQFVKPLFREVYRLVVENEQQEKIIDISGTFVPIDPRRWKEKRDVMVELKLGYGEQDREAQKMLAIHQLFSQDPALAPMYGLKNRHAMLKKILEQQGILNVDEYLTPPEQIPPPQPDPCSRCKHRWPPSSSSCRNARQVLQKCVHRRTQLSPRPRSTWMQRRQQQATRFSPTTRTSAKRNLITRSRSTKANLKCFVAAPPMFAGLHPPTG